MGQLRVWVGANCERSRLGRVGGSPCGSKGGRAAGQRQAHQLPSPAPQLVGFEMQGLGPPQCPGPGSGLA